MSEFIPTTSEGESEDRQTWDRIIRGFYALSELDSEIDLFEELDALRDETVEDAVTALFNYMLAATVPAEQSSDLRDAIELLKETGLIESWEEE